MINIPSLSTIDSTSVLRANGPSVGMSYTFDRDDSGQVPVDGRDLWSGRVTVGWKPIESLQTYLVW